MKSKIIRLTGLLFFLLYNCENKNELIQSGKIIYESTLEDSISHKYISIFDEFGEKSKMEYISINNYTKDTLEHIFYYKPGDGFVYTYFSLYKGKDHFYKDCLVKDIPTNRFEFNFAICSKILENFIVDSIKNDTNCELLCKAIFYNTYGDEKAFMKTYKNVVMNYHQYMMNLNSTNYNFNIENDTLEYVLPKAKKICLGPTMMVN